MSSSICSVPSADWVSVSFSVNLAPLVLDELRHVVSDISDVSAMSTGNGWTFPSGA